MLQAIEERLARVFGAEPAADDYLYAMRVAIRAACTVLIVKLSNPCSLNALKPVAS